MKEIPIYNSLINDFNCDTIRKLKIDSNDFTNSKKIFALQLNKEEIKDMTPKYLSNDIIIFEEEKDIQKVNNKDCIIQVEKKNLFKKVILDNNYIILVGYNIENEQCITLSKEDITNKSFKIIGIAKEKRTKID